MNTDIGELKSKPRELWKYFAKISEIPRSSGKEQRIRKFVKNFARESGLKFKEDRAGNILVFKPSRNSHSKKTVVLQSHLDIVCEKEKGAKFNFSRDALKLRYAGNFVYATGTTLGADNGIGIASMLAVLSDKKMPHPPLECLFTVSEETGLIGVSRLPGNFLTGKTFINLDSDEEGSVYTGCAGGSLVVLRFPVSFMVIPEQGFDEFEILVSGLQGGHSGVDIHKNRASAIKILTEILKELCGKFDVNPVRGRSSKDDRTSPPQAGSTSNGVKISKVEGGTKINAIPRTAQALVFISKKRTPDLKKFLSRTVEKIKEKYRCEGRLIIRHSSRSSRGKSYFCNGEEVLNFLSKLPHGVLKKNRTGVISSANFATLRTEKKSLKIQYLCRSSSIASMRTVVRKLRGTGLSSGCSISSKEIFPVWEPSEKSPVLEVSKKVYKKLFSKKLMPKIIHAGLECGVIGKKFKGMDMISIGPDIENPHTPFERVKVSSVSRFYKFLKGMLQEL